MRLARKSQRLWRRAWFRSREIGRALGASQGPQQFAFIHVMKTGGSSINSYFKDFIGSTKSGRFVAFDEFLLDRPLDTYVERAKKARYVTGHYSWRSLDAFRSPDTYVFTFLRDPYDRLRSLYFYFRSFPPKAKGAAQLRRFSSLSPEEFLTSRDPDLLFFTNNFMTRQFSGELARLLGTQEELDAAVDVAIDNLAEIDYIGFHHKFDLDFGTIVQAAGLPVPRESPRVNVTKYTPNDVDTLYQCWLSEELREMACPLIAGDALIYEQFAKARGT